MSDVYLDRRRRVAEILRDLAREIVTADLELDELESAAVAFEAVRESFLHAPRFGRNVEGFLVSETRGVLDRETSWDIDPLVGLSNPFAPPMRQLDEAGREWSVVFGHLYEGHPGLVHGGFVAAALDHVLGVTASTTEGTSMTGTLTTRYRKPTPAHVELICRGAVDRVEGRKVFCSAVLLDGETVVADAEGVFFRFDTPVPDTGG